MLFRSAWSPGRGGGLGWSRSWRGEGRLRPSDAALRDRFGPIAESDGAALNTAGPDSLGLWLLLRWWRGGGGRPRGSLLGAKGAAYDICMMCLVNTRGARVPVAASSHRPPVRLLLSAMAESHACCSASSYSPRGCERGCENQSKIRSGPRNVDPLPEPCVDVVVPSYGWGAHSQCGRQCRIHCHHTEYTSSCAAKMKKKIRGVRAMASSSARNLGDGKNS